MVGSGSTLYGGGYTATSNMIAVSDGATVVFNGWGYNQPGGWGQLDDNAAGRSVDAATLVYAGTGYIATANNRGNWTVGMDGATFDSEATGPGYWGWGVRTSGAFNSGWDDLNLQGTVTLTGSGNGDMQKMLYGFGGVIKEGSGTWVLGYSQTNAGTHDDTYLRRHDYQRRHLADSRQPACGAAIPSGPGTGNVIVNSPGTLDLNSRSAIVNGLSGDGTVSSSATGDVDFHYWRQRSDKHLLGHDPERPRRSRPGEDRCRRLDADRNELVFGRHDGRGRNAHRHKQPGDCGRD